MPQRFEIQELTSPDIAVLDEISRLRFDVCAGFEHHFRHIFPTASLADRFDPVSRHWVIMLSGRVMAAARLTVSERLTEVPDGDVFGIFESQLQPPFAMLSRLVVHEMLRGRRLSMEFDKERFLAAKNSHARTLLVLAEDWRAVHLQNKGFFRLSKGLNLPPWTTPTIPLAARVEDINLD